MASKAYIDAIAARLRGSGLIPGTLGRLRALAFTDLTQGRNPLDRIRPDRVNDTPGHDSSSEAGPASRGTARPAPAIRRRCPPSSTSWSRQARPSAGAPLPPRPLAGAC